MRAFLVFPILSVALLGCPPKQADSPPPPQPTSTSSTSMIRGTDPDHRDQIDSDGVVRRGDDLTDAKALTVAEAVAQADGLVGKSVKVTGLVNKVCQEKGCWFVMKDGDQTIRITAKDYGFFVPAKSAGMLATIEGQLSIRTLDEAEAKHLESEGAQPATMKEVAIAAAGLEMKRG